jgi:Dolichyl-phosphate-mannose-protein mannosyltransferase
MGMTGAQSSAGKATNERRRAILVGLFATLLGAFVRLAPALTAGFPLNDGGLFYVFVREIQAAQYRLPLYSSYNQATIPFVYPPLSFYLTGLISSLTGAGLLDLIRLLPPAISVLTIPAVYQLARRLMHSERSAAAATIGYALLPTAFDFMVVGGGLPRALGMLFCILALQQAVDLFAGGRRSNLAGLAILSALTVLCHPVVASFMVYSLVILLLGRGAGRRPLGHALVAGGIAVLLTSPWWAASVARHGWQPFLSAFEAGTRSWTAILAPFLFMQTNELYLALIAMFALLGLFVCLRERRFLLPVWLAAVFVFETRLTATYAALPTALLAGVGFGELVLPALLGHEVDVERPASSTAGPLQPGSPRQAPAVGWVPALATAYFLIYLLIAAFLAAPRAALPESQRTAMQWAKSNTPVASRFAVISGIRLAGVDFVSEWFPALAERTSVSTPQGYEWFAGQLFDARWELHSELQDCGSADVACLESWAARAQAPFTHVYLVRAGQEPRVGTEDLYASLASSPQYEEIYQREEVAIFYFRPAATGSP